MADVPGKTAGQGLDIEKLLALLPVLQAVLSGKPLTALIPPPPPPPPPPPAQPDLAELIKALGPLLAAFRGQPAAVAPPPPPPPPVEPVKPPPASSAITKPAVQVTGLASVLTILGQLAGILPASIGDGATTAGIMTTAIPLLATALAPTGIFGTIFGGLFRMMGSMAPK